jgi:hypothetical protein
VVFEVDSSGSVPDEDSEDRFSLARVSRRSPWFAGEVGPQTQVSQEGGASLAGPETGKMSDERAGKAGRSFAAEQQQHLPVTCRTQQARGFPAFWMEPATAAGELQSIPATAMRAISGNRRWRIW